MALTFLVEDGTGLPGANSYVSLAEANDYIAANIHVTESWSDLGEDEQQALLIMASRNLDQRATWNGYRVSTESGLRWPRSRVFDVDNNLIPSNVIPRQLKQATIEMARFLISDDRTADRGQDGLKELQVDVIKLVFDSSYRLPEVPNEIGFILRGLGSVAAGRQQFAKIVKA